MSATDTSSYATLLHSLIHILVQRDLQLPRTFLCQFVIHLAAKHDIIESVGRRRPLQQALCL